MPLGSTSTQAPKKPTTKPSDATSSSAGASSHSESGRSVEKLRPESPVVLEESSSIADVCKAMAAKRTDCCLVTSSVGTLAGIVTDTAGKFNVKAQVRGGGLSGQAEAMRLAIATAMQGLDMRYRPVLKKAGLLKVDARRVERLKPGQPGARKKNAWVKR